MIFQLITPFLQCVATSTLLVLVLRQHRQSQETRLFSLFLASMSLWGLFIGLMRTSANGSLALYWERVALIMIALTASSFYLFSSSYARLALRWRIIALVCFILFTIIAIPTNMLVRGMGTDRFGNAPIWGSTFYVWMVIIYLLIGLAITNLNHGRRRATSYEIRNRYLYLIAGAGLCLMGGVFDILPTLGIPVYPGTIVANIGFAVLTTLAISQYHLFDIQVVLTAGFAYAATTLVVAIPTVGLASLWIWFAASRGYSQMVLFSPLLIFVILIPPFWNRVDSLITQRVRRERYMHLKNLDEFNQKKVYLTDLSELCNLIVKLVKSAVAPSFICFLVQREDSSYQVLASQGREKAEVEHLQLHAEHPLLEMLRQEKQPIWHRQINITPRFQAMPQSERDALNLINAELYVPVAGTAMVGVLAIGNKPLGRVYSREDIDFLNTLANQVGLVLENIRLLNMEMAQRRRVEQFNAERATFLDALAHEMKTPLTSAISSAELLAAELSSQDGNLNLLAADVQNSVNNLSRLVSDILDFGRIQQTRISFNVEPVELCQLVRQAKTEARVSLERKQQRLELVLPEMPVWVMADPVRAKQVLYNLIGNASKFSQVESNLLIRVSQRDRDAKVEIVDEAEPISGEEREHMFTPYYRGKMAQEKHLPGLGLGLYICRRLLEGQRGKIWLENGENRGNIFCFSLPLEGVYESTGN